MCRLFFLFICHVFITREESNRNVSITFLRARTACKYQSVRKLNISVSALAFT